MIYPSSMHLFKLTLTVLLLVSGESYSQTNRNDPMVLAMGCDTLMSYLQEELFFSCPISDGPMASISYLNTLPEFVQLNLIRKPSHYKAVSFAAHNASLFNVRLINDSSMIGLNYKVLPNDTNVLEAVVGVYYFKNAANMDAAFNHILEFLNNTLHLKPEERASTSASINLKYILPCHSILFITQVKNKTNEGIRLQWLNSSQQTKALLAGFSEKLLAAPDTVSIDDQSFFLKTNMRKDFMPTIPDHGPSSYATLTLFSSDPATLEDSIYIDRIWMVNQQKEIWIPLETVKKYNHGSIGPDHLDIDLNELPPWGAKITVDVIVRIGDTKGNQYLLRAPNQWISRTE